VETFSTSYIRQGPNGDGRSTILNFIKKKEENIATITGEAQLLE